jgi:hypothetical protein
VHGTATHFLRGLHCTGRLRFFQRGHIRSQRLSTRGFAFPQATRVGLWGGEGTSDGLVVGSLEFIFIAIPSNIGKPVYHQQLKHGQMTDKQK